MEFEFKDSQWIDGRKLSDWQKQWCLVNLNYASKCSLRQFKESVYDLIMFKSLWSTGGSDSFGTTSYDYIKPENEITFNDFYWEDEEVTQESIFDNPRWVTFDASQDLMGCFLDLLVDGKDYKVSKTKTLTGGDKNYLLENGVRAHESYFHKITPEDLKPAVHSEEEDSFDNLVYTPVASDWDYLVLNNLSSEQKDYLMGNIIGMPNLHNTCNASVGFNSESNLWIRGAIDCSRKEIYFNDLFQEVKTHQD